MAGVIDYLIPTDSMTLTAQENMRRAAVIALLQMCIDKNIGDGQDISNVLGLWQSGSSQRPNSLEVREFQNVLDAGTVLDNYITAALAVVGTPVSIFQAVAAPVVANNRCVCFYGLSIPTVAVGGGSPISRVTFRVNGALGNIVAVFDTEGLDVEQRVDAYFSEPVVFGPTTTFAVQATPRIATLAVARVVLKSLVAEPQGAVISSYAG